MMSLKGSKVRPADECSVVFTSIKPSSPRSSIKPSALLAGSAANKSSSDLHRDLVIGSSQPKKSSILGRVGRWLSEASKRSGSLRKSMKYPMKNPFKKKDRLVKAEQASHDKLAARCGPELVWTEAGQTTAASTQEELTNEADISIDNTSFYSSSSGNGTPSLMGIGVDVDGEDERRIQCLLPQLRIDMPIPEEADRLMKFFDRDSLIRFLVDLSHMDSEAVSELFPNWPHIQVADAFETAVRVDDVLRIQLSRFPLTLRCAETKAKKDGVVPHALSKLVLPQFLDECVADVDDIQFKRQPVDMQRRYDDTPIQVLDGDIFSLCDPWSFVIVDELDFNYDQERENAAKRSNRTY